MFFYGSRILVPLFCPWMSCPRLPLSQAQSDWVRSSLLPVERSQLVGRGSCWPPMPAMSDMGYSRWYCWNYDMNMIQCSMTRYVIWYVMWIWYDRDMVLIWFWHILLWLCAIMVCCVRWRYAMHFLLCYAMLCYVNVMFCYVMLCYVVLC